MQLYEKIPILRKAKGLTQSELADNIDVSRQSVQKWETGITCPDISKLPELARILGVSVDELLDTNLGRDELLGSALKQDTATAASVERIVEKPAKQRRSILDYLLMIPIVLGIVIVLGMFYVFGAMFVGICFTISLFCLCGGLAAVLVTFINLQNGDAAVMIAVAGIFLGLGLCAPFYYFSQWLRKAYLLLTNKLTAKLKTIDVRSLLQ